MKIKFILSAVIIAISASTLAAKTESGKAKNAAAPKLETATFAAGCFGGTEEFFRKIPGVMHTEVGYTGGTFPNPKYEDTLNSKSGHAESVEIQFDPKVVSYEHLLDQFFKMHNPTTPNEQVSEKGDDKGSEYRSAIFYHDEAQKKWLKHLKQRWKNPTLGKNQSSPKSPPRKNSGPRKKNIKNICRNIPVVTTTIICGPSRSTVGNNLKRVADGCAGRQFRDRGG